jgi:hypothetical protein
VLLCGTGDAAGEPDRDAGGHSGDEVGGEPAPSAVAAESDPGWLLRDARIGQDSYGKYGDAYPEGGGQQDGTGGAAGPHPGHDQRLNRTGGDQPDRRHQQQRRPPPYQPVLDSHDEADCERDLDQVD